MTTKRKAEPSVSTASSKKKKVNGAAKGKAFEREIANWLSHIFPEAERQLEMQASSVVGVDIQGTDIFKIQCKNYQNYAPVGKIFEVRLQSKKDIPVLVTKGIRMEAMAVIPFQKFVTLLEIAYGLASTLKVPEVRNNKDFILGESEPHAEVLDLGKFI